MLIFCSLLPVADNEFDFRFIQNKFGVSCAVCDRLWFEKDMKHVPQKAVDFLLEKYPDLGSHNMSICNTCYKTLLSNKVPRFATINGFCYPPFPSDLPPLDSISERLVSPRLPFMQIRRLRLLHGSKGIAGQVINIPVDVNSMVSELPRQLDDDLAFNVHIKRHLIHKSTYLTGYVKKSVVKRWLRFLVTKPLYLGFRINESLYREYDNSPALAPVPEAEADASGEPMIEPISENPEHVNDLLLSKQQTLMWSEDKYLELAPGMNKHHLSLLFDEHAEELLFLSIYLGEPRKFTIDGFTPYMMFISEIRRSDRRGVKPEHVLYMAMKVMRMRLTESMFCTFKNSDNLKKLTRENIEDKQFMDSMIE